jgi:putative mRNA 3-end processing factor
MVRWLRQVGLDASGFDTEYGDEDDPQGEAPAAAVAQAIVEPGTEAAGEESEAGEVSDA